MAGVGAGAYRGASNVPNYTTFSYLPKWTKNSSTQIEVNLSQSNVIDNLQANGFVRTTSKDGSVSILKGEGQTYRFYPQSSSDGRPSAKLSIDGVKRPVATLRFNK
jgi:filamentous hemagglutinin